MSTSEKPTAAFVLSLIAGIVILINGTLFGLIGTFIDRWLSVPVGPFRPLPFGPFGPSGPEFVSTILYVLMAVGSIFGVLVLMGAFMVYRNPAQKTIWGVIILVFSILSIVIGGGFIIGFVLGIIGGTFALTWKPMTVSTK